MNLLARHHLREQLNSNRAKTLTIVFGRHASVSRWIILSQALIRSVGQSQKSLLQLMCPGRSIQMWSCSHSGTLRGYSIDFQHGRECCNMFISKNLPFQGHRSHTSLDNTASINHIVAETFSEVQSSLPTDILSLTPPRRYAHLDFTLCRMI